MQCSAVQYSAVLYCAVQCSSGSRDSRVGSVPAEGAIQAHKLSLELRSTLYFGECSLVQCSVV